MLQMKLFSLTFSSHRNLDPLQHDTLDFLSKSFVFVFHREHIGHFDVFFVYVGLAQLVPLSVYIVS